MVELLSYIYIVFAGLGQWSFSMMFQVVCLNEGCTQWASLWALFCKMKLALATADFFRGFAKIWIMPPVF